MNNQLEIGFQSGRWEVIGNPVNPNPGPGKHIYYPCRCTCGTEKNIRSSVLRTQQSVSCGCLNSEVTSKRLTKHGYYGTRLYRIWQGMKQRCHALYGSGYYRYGAKGISVCKEWHDFIPFCDWALANGYADDLQIDRIDSEGNYEPSNCRWVSQSDNMQNLIKSQRITAFGETRTLRQWFNDPRCAVNLGTLRSRWQRGWQDELAITTPA